jgi:excisionase family DNA binding protein
MPNVIPLDRERPRRYSGGQHGDEPAVYTVPEVARLLRLHLGGVYELLRNGTIPAERLGRRWIISRVRFHAWLDGTGEEGR